MRSLLLDTNDWRLKQNGAWLVIRDELKIALGSKSSFEVTINDMRTEVDRSNKDSSDFDFDCSDEFKNLVCICTVSFRKGGLPFFKGAWNTMYITVDAIEVEKGMLAELRQNNTEYKIRPLLQRGEPISYDDPRTKKIIFNL